MHIIQSCYSVFNTRIYKFLLLLIVFVAIGLIPFPLEAREVISLNRDWLFHAGDVADGASAHTLSPGWITVNVPHDYQISQPWVAPGVDERGDADNPVANVASRLSSRGFKEMGCGWYRKTIIPDNDWKGRRILLDFEGIMLVGDVYLNGELIGGTDYGYLGFEIDVTDKLRYGEENVIAVRADTGSPENSRWYTGGGLYRDVNLKITDPELYFTRHPLYVTTPEVERDRAVVRIQAEVANHIASLDSLRMKTVIRDADGKAVYEAESSHRFNRKQTIKEYEADSLVLDNPRLWDCETPHLYTATVTLLRPDATVADEVSTRFGVRKLEYSPEYGLRINGKKVLLKGIANHHTLGALGAAAYPRAIEKRIRLLKDFGFNHIRCSHNPYSESLMDLCDEYGILVVDELYDKWLTQYAGGRKDWMEQWPHDVPEWVRRDRNHPCVVMWSLGNELQLLWDIPYADWGVTPYRMQKALLDRYDRTRPVTVAMHPRGRNEKTDSLPAPLAMETDVAAYNYRYMYFPGDSRRFPRMMFYQSEANTSNMGPNYFDMDLDKVIGLAYWGMIDYLGESAGWPAKGWEQGVFDISLEPKPNAYFLKSYFKEDEPLVHIAGYEDEEPYIWNDIQMGGKRLSDHWNYPEPSILKLYTYTNADEVELKINGKTIGRKRNDRTDSRRRNRIMWENVEYSPGNIEAFAYNDGESNPVARHRIETSGRASHLLLTADNADWRADGTDLQHVRVEAVDKKGRRDVSARGMLTFSVEGPAEIVGVINGDNRSNELTVGNSRSLYNGTATVILRSKPESGTALLRITSPDFKPVMMKLPVSPVDGK